VHGRVKDDKPEASPSTEQVTRVKQADLDESDISLFKRIVHQTLNRKSRFLSPFEEEAFDIHMDLDDDSDLSESSDEDEMSRRGRIMLRKKSGELVRPALRPPAARRRKSGTPGTPTFPKNTHFDSHLEHVRHFLQVDRPIEISRGEPDLDSEEDESHYGTVGAWNSEEGRQSLERRKNLNHQFPKGVYFDSSDDEPRRRQLENLAELQKAIRMIEHHRATSPARGHKTRRGYTASQITPLTTEQTIVNEGRADDRLEEALRNLGLD
jgi:hypothetical protein